MKEKKWQLTIQALLLAELSPQELSTFMIKVSGYTCGFQIEKNHITKPSTRQGIASVLFCKPGCPRWLRPSLGVWIMKIYCRKCGIELSGDLQELHDPSTLCQENGKDHLPLGFYRMSEGEYYTGSDGQILANVRDIRNLTNHLDSSRLSGCCGLDGCDGINKLCQNGHEVATEKSDCWMAHAVLFDLRRVEMK